MSDEMRQSHWSENDDPPADVAARYGRMIDGLREFLDRVAAARPDDNSLAALEHDLARWSNRLAPMAVPELDQLFAHCRRLPGRGQTMAPMLVVEQEDGQAMRGHVTFGRYFLGGNGAAHGGAVALLFDEILGRLANAGGRARSRTAFLHVDYRSITPIERQLSVHGWFEREEGRKRILRAELRDGDTLCAEAEGLFVRLNPGQP